MLSRLLILPVLVAEIWENISKMSTCVWHAETLGWIFSTVCINQHNQDGLEDVLTLLDLSGTGLRVTWNVPCIAKKIQKQSKDSELTTQKWGKR